MNHKTFKYIGVLFLIFGLLVCTYAKENGSGTRSLHKTSAEPSIYKFNVNNISTFIYWDGRADVNGGNSGFEFPKGSNRFAVYESGFTWGGRVNGGEVRFGGSTFPSGLVGGKIGTNPADSRMYRVRPDWNTGSMLSELNDGEKSGDEAAIREQYRVDWMEWPWQDGAPYLDADGDEIYTPDPDGNGVYDLGEDIPGFPGASQTIYFIANAADGDKTRQFYASPAQQIEMHCTVWGYTSVGPLGNMIFKKYLLKNLGVDDYTDFYVGVWCDPDVGGAGDDFAGCDTLLSLGYAYNSDNDDNQYQDRAPASGHDFFQGPIVEATEADSALVNGEKIPGYKNLGMTAFYYFVNENGTAYSDPTLDDYATGTLYFYNLLQGKVAATGEYFEVPEELGGGTTNYPLSGDPVLGTGYLDGIIKPTDDRRYGLASGPFILAAGDEQEIVVAQLVAQGTNNINSVLLLKNYDAVAQDAYNSNFVLPSAPTPPQVTYTVSDQEILLMWDSNPEMVASTESHNQKGYAFQGYNVYQLPTASSSITDATKIATFDIVDGLKTITDKAVDPATQAEIIEVVQHGNDTGLQRYFKIERDYINNIDLYNGNAYYFAVTSYAYSGDEFAIPNTLENPPVAITIVPQTVAPGIRPTMEVPSDYTVEHTGSANASVSVKVVNPAQTTGHEYEVNFKTQHYYMDYDGAWKKTNYADSVGGALSKLNDLTGSYLSAVSYTSEIVGTRDLKFVLELVAADYDYCDGVSITLPSSVHINSAEVAVGNTYGHEFDPVIDEETNTVTWGEEVVSGDGEFLGGEVFTINVDVVTLPLDVSYVIYDDGWATGYGEPYASLGNGVVNSVGTMTITEEGYAFKTENEWSVVDNTTQETFLTEQTHLNGTDIYGGATVGEEYTLTVDGMLINVNGSYDAPQVYDEVYLNDELMNESGGYWDADGYELVDYTWFGYPDGTAATYFDADGEVGGTRETAKLQKDIEFRFTGERETVTLNGQEVEITKEGTGSMATLIGARQYDIANHPLNPNPGSSEPFLVRIPFEVWNVDDNQQVNYEIYDRGQGDPAAAGFKVWNTDARMYCIVYDTPYEETVTRTRADYDTENHTWANVWYACDYVAGDVIKTTYANPLIPGVDKFTWTSATPSEFDNELAKQDIAEDVNVFPNPYYGANPQELNKYQRFVTFSHLPENTTIRIFNLAGQQVRVIEKTTNDQFQRWDLLNSKQLPVASGIYIAYIDMPDIGTTKILKLAIIQEQQILDRF